MSSFDSCTDLAINTKLPNNCVCLVKKKIQNVQSKYI